MAANIVLGEVGVGGEEGRWRFLKHLFSHNNHSGVANDLQVPQSASDRQVPSVL